MRPARPVVVIAALAVLMGCSRDQAGPSLSQSSTVAPTPAVSPSTTTTTVALAQLSWHPRTSAPVARQEVAAAELDGKVWVVGGITAADASARVESYDPATDRWSAGPDLPLTLHHLALVVYRGELVVAGGFQGGGSGLYSRPTDRVLALRGGAWVDLPRLRRPRGAAGAAVVGDRLYVAGGRDAGLLIAPTEVFDGTAWQDKAAVPTLRDHLAVVSDGRVLYAVGGRILDPSATSDAFERYDPGRDLWEPLAPLPTARGGLGAAWLANRLVTAGGENAVRTYPQVEAFDPSTGSWSTLAPLPTSRHGLGVAAVGGTLFALLGGKQAGVDPSTTAEALS